MTFGSRVHAAVRARGPLCAGIDPHAALLHDWGLDDSVAGLERFALTATEALAAECAVVKPQSAFYERFGSRGVAVLERVIGLAREQGALVLLDVKRGDIGSTSQAYADAYLDPASPLAADAITVSPYLGFGSLEPFVDTARKHDAGLFVLARTSNTEAPEVQAAVGEDGRTVTGTMIDHLRHLNAGESPLGSFGAVVVGNALPAGLPDGRPGGLSGPAIRPLALRCVAEVRAHLPDVEVIGCGGIATADDARTFLAAGATAVQVGTALLHDPTTVARMIDDLSGDAA